MDNQNNQQGHGETITQNNQNNQQFTQQNQQFMQQNQQYQQYAQQNPYGHVANLKSDRSLVKFILLSIVTCGIYSIIAMGEMANSLNTIATRYDGKNTKGYFVAILLGFVTLGIYPLVWYHCTSERVGNELNRRNLNIDFGARDFWIWCVAASLVASFIAGLTGLLSLAYASYVFNAIYIYKLINAMNALSTDYNQRG